MSSTSHYGTTETRKRILDTSWELLEQQGSGITLAQVADRAGVSRQAVYLHFRDRTGLLIALVDHIDESLGRDDLRAHIHGADTGVEGLRRWVTTMGWYTAKIDRVTEVLEGSQYMDPGLSAAWRDRMAGRREHVRRLVQRVADEGRLGEGWSPTSATELVYAVTMPAPWRELTRHLGWTSEQYAEHMWRLIASGVLAEDRDGRPEGT